MTEEMSFEEALAQLEESVALLEGGDARLDEALRIFERGVTASRTCAKWLDETRKRVQILTCDEDGEFQLAFMDDDEAAPDAGSPAPDKT
jgi:exodeoxyribonuclease VII small subunit